VAFPEAISAFFNCWIKVAWQVLLDPNPCGLGPEIPVVLRNGSQDCFCDVVVTKVIELDRRVKNPGNNAAELV